MRFEDKVPEALPPKKDITSGPDVANTGGKLNRDKAKAKPSDRLRPDADKNLNKSKLRSDKSGDKLARAKDKLAAQKPIKKPGPVKAAGHAAKAEAWHHIHHKIYQVEDENAGIKAAHRTELTGESAFHGVARFTKHRNLTRPARRVRTWEKRDMKEIGRAHV